MKTGSAGNKKKQSGAQRRNAGPRFLVLFLLAVLLLFALHTRYPSWTGENEASQEETAAGPAGLSGSIVDSAPERIPEYSGTGCIELSHNLPGFTEADVKKMRGQSYSPPDRLGRCGTAYAMLDRSMMPKEKRGEIGDIRPTGWQQARYPGIIDSDPPYLYNRCHLIAYALTGQNANAQNLVTGTRYLNIELMLPYEIKIAQYLDHSDNHVLYRVSPYFRNRELLARGVEMEAYSVEDDGAGICFHVFLYNVQPGVLIDYLTGESRALKTDVGEKEYGQSNRPDHYRIRV